MIVDRNFLVKKDLIHLETSGNRHWLSRTKVNTKWAIREKLGKDDYLVEWDVNETGLPSTWTLRAIHYQKKGFPRATLLTSLLDPEQYPAEDSRAVSRALGNGARATTRSRRTCWIGKSRFAPRRLTAYAKSCGASLSLTTSCGSRWSERPRRPASHPRGSALWQPSR